MTLISKCCGAELDTHYGEEGTNCFVCSACKKPCSVIESKSEDDFYDGEIKKENIEEETSSEETEFLKSEIQKCEDMRLSSIKTAEASINARDFYSRRLQFLNKILDLINK